MRRITKALITTAAVAPLVLLGPVAAQADSENANVGFGTLYFEDEVVSTVATPAAIPGRGVDDIFPVVNGMVEGQLPITSVVPGRGYHGGRWAVNTVTWEPNHVKDAYRLTSVADVKEAESMGKVKVMRVPGADFVCPVHVNKGKKN